MDDVIILAPRNQRKERKRGFIVLLIGVISLLISILLIFDSKNIIKIPSIRVFAIIPFLVSLIILGYGLSVLYYSRLVLNFCYMERFLIIEKAYSNNEEQYYELPWKKIDNISIIRERKQSSYQSIAEIVLSISFTIKSQKRSIYLKMKPYSKNIQLQEDQAKNLQVEWLKRNRLSKSTNIDVTTDSQHFYCQIDQELHFITESHYTCITCRRYLCESCYSVSLSVGKSNCPNCNGELVKV